MISKNEYLSAHPDLHEGMSAFDPSGERLGKVERLDDDNVIIEKGWLFRRDIAVAYDNIEKIGEDKVFVNPGRTVWKGRSRKVTRSEPQRDVTTTKERTAVRQEAGVRTAPQADQRDASADVRRAEVEDEEHLPEQHW